jgi:hypothetical protein
MVSAMPPAPAAVNSRVATTPASVIWTLSLQEIRGAAGRKTSRVRTT